GGDRPADASAVRGGRGGSRVTAVVVHQRAADDARGCVESLSAEPDLGVVVVDNGSRLPLGLLAAVTTIRSEGAREPRRPPPAAGPRSRRSGCAERGGCVGASCDRRSGRQSSNRKDESMASSSGRTTTQRTLSALDSSKRYGLVTNIHEAEVSCP